MGRLAIALVLVACSPTHTETGGQHDAPPVDDGSAMGDGSTVDALTAAEACAQLSVARCEKLQMCSTADLTRRFGDVGTCETREALACTAAQEAPDTSADPGQALTCGAALTASACDDFLSKAPPAACAVPAGTGAGGCAFGAQCESTFCAVGAEALCGQCRAVPTVGTDCTTSGCGPTLICADNPKTCQVPGTNNSACNQATPCGNGFSCVGATQTSKGTCKPEATTVGAQCDPNHKTRAGCSGDNGLTCNQNNNTCVNEPIVAAGKPCGDVNGVHNACAAGATCEIPTNQTKGTCVAPAADGAACDIKNGPDCLFPARCIPVSPGLTNGTCGLPGSQSCI